MTEELIEKAKEAQSPEELLTLMQENGMDDFTKEEAEGLYAELHISGELTDEELEHVSGGSINVTVGGQKYRIVTCDTACFNDRWIENNLTVSRSDHKSLRKMWSFCTGCVYVCGTCYHLGFTKALTGYCEVEHGS